jgi:outer membrane scaffolding protein for murein synthesis (MipA/OmpV family)
MLGLLFPALSYAGLEVGIGAATSYLPHYIGSDESEIFYVPFPYLRYRSEKITIDRNLIQGNLWHSGNWSLELSLGGSVKVDSDKSKARSGMDDLDFIIEGGPALHYYFLGDRSKDNALFIAFPVRAAISTDFTSADYQGITFNPSAVWRRGYWMGEYEVRPQISLGLRSGDSKFHDYFYGVDLKDVTAQRSAYSGQSGYGGIQFNYSTAVLWDNWLAAGFMRYINAKGASFESSSLVKQDENWVVGFAVAYLFAGE